MNLIDRQFIDKALRSTHQKIEDNMTTEVKHHHLQVGAVSHLLPNYGTTEH